MKISRPILIASIGTSLLGCWPATEEDRKALVGLWTPDDGSRHTIEFKDNGVFDFVYDAGPPRTVLRIKAKTLGREGIALLQVDCDWYDPVRFVLNTLLPHTTDDARVILDDYYFWEGCARATHDFVASSGQAYRIRTIGELSAPGSRRRPAEAVFFPHCSAVTLIAGNAVPGRLHRTPSISLRGSPDGGQGAPGVRHFGHLVEGGTHGRRSRHRRNRPSRRRPGLERSAGRSGRAHQAVPARLVRRHRARRAGGADRHPGARGAGGRRQGPGLAGRPQREGAALGGDPDQRRREPRARLRRRQFLHGRPSDRHRGPCPAGAGRADQGVGPAVHRELRRRLRDLGPRRPPGLAQPLPEGLPRHRHGRLVLGHRRGRPHARASATSSSPSPSASPPPRPPA